MSPVQTGSQYQAMCLQSQDRGAVGAGETWDRQTYLVHIGNMGLGPHGNC